MLLPEKHKPLTIIIALVLLPFIPLFFIVNIHIVLVLLLFLITSLYYSATPIRAKAKLTNWCGAKEEGS